MIHHSFINNLISLSPSRRRLLLIAMDALLLLLSVWFCSWLRTAQPFHTSLLIDFRWLLPSIILLGLPLYAFTGQYKGLTRYVGSESLYRLSARNLLLVLLLVGFGEIFLFPMPPRSSWILLWLLLTGFTGVVRFCLRDVLLNLRSVRHSQQIRVAIYGAGSAGVQLAAALRLAGNYSIVAFFDDNPNYWKRSINEIPIQPHQVLDQLIGSIDQVLLAIPSLARSERRRIVNHLQERGVSVLQVPSVDDLTSGRARIDSLRPIAIEDLLGRDPVVVDDFQSQGSFVRSSVVCVTGAGGSIGSELCFQILKLLPAKLILLEHSEPALYTIERQLRQQLPDGVILQSVLGSATDFTLLECLFTDQHVDLILHAAAYKHVPLVEANPLTGLANNIGSTYAVCRAAASTGVSRMMLISTDKAVRPTNIMGASKRLSELIIQAFAENSSTTRFSMVRFGNVLGSSGSVVPLFRHQIASGGPITLTHPEIIRYFMTIPEAAQLVVVASLFSEGGEVFLLDMGEPVRIKDLAEHMVLLSGLTVRDVHNPDGDIEILCTGLRPGEKLYEELLIDAECEPTPHPLIYRAHERLIPSYILFPQIDSLQKAIEQRDLASSFDLLSSLVPEWHSCDVDSLK